jgi:hypothetical protein
MEVELDNGEDIASISFSDLHKCFFPRDFIEVTSGLLQKQIGWVESATDEMISILEYIVGEKK